MKRNRKPHDLAPFLSMVLLFVLFTLITPRFAGLGNIKMISKQVAINGILGVALFLVVLTGGIDISIGSTLSLLCVLTGFLESKKIPFLIVVLLVLLCGGVVGYLKGILVTKIRLPDLIVTLAAKNLIRGIALMFSVQAYVITSPAMVSLGSGQLFGVIPYPFLCFMAVALVTALILGKTRFGRRIYAMGGNREAAIQAGIDVGRTKRSVYAFSGILVGVGAVLYSSLYKNILASKIGSDTLNTLLAVVLLGGASMSGGYGKVPGIVFGALTMAILNNGMILARSTDYWVTALTGILILVSMMVQFLQNSELFKRNRLGGAKKK
ncbi:MAG: ABC transporter permease [Lachnospiraceae bacterium]|jgi:ribose transport system permease protein|nr:ABC transporter permease [Lachnospiraceae bacterium]